MLVVNLFGAPGSGKSTLAHLLTGLLKKCHVSCELAGEYAKDIVLDRSPHFLTNQFRILGEQSWRVERLAASGTDIAITDSPVALVAFYATRLYPDRYENNFKEVVLAAYKEWNSIEFFLLRNHPYENRGRLQSEIESDAMVSELEAWLDDCGIHPLKLKTSDLIAERVFCELVRAGLHIPEIGLQTARKIAASLLATPPTAEDAAVAAEAIAKLVSV